MSLIALTSQRNYMLVAFVIALGFHLFLLFGFKDRFYQLPEAALQQGNSNLEVGLIDVLPQEGRPATTSSKEEKILLQESSSDAVAKNEAEKKLKKATSQENRASLASANKHVGALHAKPAYLYNPQPTYPEAERINGHEGTVLLRVLVSKGGDVAHAAVEHSSGYPTLDQRALETVQASWKFHPAMLDHQAVPTEIFIPVRFSLVSR